MQPSRLLCPWDFPGDSGDLPNTGIKSASLTLAGRFFTAKPPGKPSFFSSNSALTWSFCLPKQVPPMPFLATPIEVCEFLTCPDSPQRDSPLHQRCSFPSFAWICPDSKSVESVCPIVQLWFWGQPWLVKSRIPHWLLSIMTVFTGERGHCPTEDKSQLIFFLSTSWKEEHLYLFMNSKLWLWQTRLQVDPCLVPTSCVHTWSPEGSAVCFGGHPPWST